LCSSHRGISLINFFGLARTLIVDDTEGSDGKL